MMLQTPRPIIWVLTFLSAAALTGALIAQYKFGLHPCELCLYQRVPYVIAIVLGAASLAVRPRAILVLMALCFLIGAAIAGFHAGVEYRFWEGLGSCSMKLDFSSADALRNQIMNAPKARCDEAAWTLFGVSMAGYNFFYSLALAIVSLLSLRVK